MTGKTAPDFQFETRAIAAGASRVVGVDEVGRGPLAGPVLAAAVWLNPDNIPDGLNDSKKLSPARRQALAERLHEVADVGIGLASVAEIEEHNIHNAAQQAMMRAVFALRVRPDYLLIDGKFGPKGLNLPAETIVKGDGRVLSIAAASIVAKVERDRIMADLAREMPGYGWETNAGYPTPAHKAALLRLGVTAHHRRTFRPVHEALFS
ncbi:MAG: ribonuclease HII [Qingshengfaniella sp.]